MTKPPSTAETDPGVVLANYDETHLGCRVDRHQWSREPLWETHDELHDKRIKICSQCGTRAVWVVNITTYEIVRRYYRPARGYSARGTGLGLADFRHRLLHEQHQAELKRRKRRKGPVRVA